MPEEKKEYYEWNDFNDEEAAFVLDGTAFNGLKREKAILGRIERAIDRKKDPLSCPPDKRNLVEDFAMEANHLHYLADSIRCTDNIFITEEIISEVHKYYRKLGYVFNDYYDAGFDHVPVFSFIGGLADAICAAQNYGVPRTQRLIRDNRSRFNGYLDIIKELMKEEMTPVPEEDKDLFEELYQDPDLLVQPRRKQKLKPKHMTEADAKLLAFGLTAAHKESTILFTGDIRHVEKAARDTYGYFVLNGSSDLTGRPPNRFMVYVGFTQGWKLQVDSELVTKVTSA